MALGDWTRYVYGTVKVYLDVETPIVGDASVAINLNGAQTGVNMHLNDTFERGFTSGRMRTYIRYKSIDFPGTGEDQLYGIVFMQDQLDVVESGSGYFFGFAAVEDNPDIRITLRKFSNGLFAPAGHDILYEDTFHEDVEDGDYWPIQITWDADIQNLGGTRLTAMAGTKNGAFTTMTLVVDYNDTVDPLVTSVAEGICGTGALTTLVETDEVVTFDETAIFESV